MSVKSAFFPQDFYKNNLSSINNVHFTRREIDVISCLVNAMGAKKMATLLGLKLSSVHSHLLNVRAKLKCNSGAAIISFVENSGKMPTIRHYFYLLQSEILFKQSLHYISKINPEKKACCIYILEKKKDPFLLHLKTHLEVAGLSTSLSMHEKNADYTLFVFPHVFEGTSLSSFVPQILHRKNKVIVVLRGERHADRIPQELKKWDVADFTNLENYFFTFFLLLKKLLPHINIENIIVEFRDRYKRIQENYKFPPSSAANDLSETPPADKKWVFFIFSCFLMILLVVGSAFYWVHKSHRVPAIVTNLSISGATLFLDRSELLSLIDNEFKGKNGIQTIALIGIGGSGKTTLAQQYAQRQKETLIWELNAETKSNLNESFESLASALSLTQKDKGILDELRKIKNPSDREKELVEFVREHLKLHENWLLIYDNIQKFSDIQRYFPQNFKTWGKGRIILTTRNSNIKNNTYVNHSIQIGELNEDQKLELFTKIMTQNTKNSFNTEQIAGAEKFLKEIPPFPLDVSVAAYYIKATEIPYERYIEILYKNDDDFESMQKNILKEYGEYTRTRSGIIILSIKNILSSKKEFQDLLLLISLLNSQNIPRDLLDQYKSASVVDNFIYHLKKYSLMTSEFIPYIGSSSCFSIHRSTQAIALAYLRKSLDLEKNKHFIEQVSSMFENYIAENTSKRDFIKMTLLVRHCEFFLDHPYLLPEFTIASINSQLGDMYRWQGNSEKARKVLIKSLEIYRYHFSENYTRIARTLEALGNVYRDLGHYKQAKQSIEEGLVICRKNSFRDDLWFAQAFAELGAINRELGDYKTAQHVLEESLTIYKTHPHKGQLGMLLALMRLGSVYLYQGCYQKAQGCLEESLAIYRENSDATQPWVAWNLVWLGKVYREQGHYEKAKQCLEEGLAIYKDNFHENQPWVAWGLAELGNIYREQVNYAEAKYLLNKSIQIYEILFGKDHLESAPGILSLGRVYLLEDNLDIAESLTRKALKIFQLNDHPESYTCLESLADLALKRSVYAKQEGKAQQSQALRMQAMIYLKQAQHIVTLHFPKNSQHIIRIQSKLEKLNIDQKELCPKSM